MPQAHKQRAVSTHSILQTGCDAPLDWRKWSFYQIHLIATVTFLGFNRCFPNNDLFGKEDFSQQQGLMLLEMCPYQYPVCMIVIQKEEEKKKHMPWNNALAISHFCSDPHSCQSSKIRLFISTMCQSLLCLCWVTAYHVQYMTWPAHNFKLESKKYNQTHEMLSQ